jgi:hypothetical protein
MNRNKALIELAPHEVVLVTPRQLGAFFCGETFRFVLDPCTRRAAERIARWHGCEFQFHESTGCGSFEKRGWLAGFVVALVESAVQRLERWARSASWVPNHAHAATQTPA